MSSGHAIRGSRVGSGPAGEPERGRVAPRFTVEYWCGSGHVTRPSFATGDGVQIPDTWPCPKCGQPAGRDREHPPAEIVDKPFKTHLDYVKERRSPAQGAAALDEALDALRHRQGRPGPRA